jgi:exopolysaccharide biosynthesis polyprenyl glycosylphosphotransferase
VLKENWRFIARVQQVGDIFIVLIAFICAYYGRSILLYVNNSFELGLPFGGEKLAPLKDYFIVLLSGVVTYSLVLSRVGAYHSMRLADFAKLVYQLLISASIVFLVLAAVVFLFKLDFSRSFIVLFCASSGVMLLLQRCAVLAFLRYWRRRGRNFRNVIIVGTGSQGMRLAREISQRPELGIGIKRFARLDLVNPWALSVHERKELEYFEHQRIKNPVLASVPVLAGRAMVEACLENEAIDEMIFTDIVPVMLDVEALMQNCSDRGIRTTIAGDLFSTGITKSDISYFTGMPLIHFQPPPGDRWELSLKRILDFTGSAILLLLLWPLMFVIAVSIKCTSSGPVLFKQKRVGLNGRRFSLYKFRSMNINAEAQKGALLAFNKMRGPVFKMENDPRCTAVGSFLRKYSLDELPQLWNVLRGDMSLVGPRPPIPGEVSLYERTDRRRLSMRPGLTCLWQVSGRNSIDDFETWVRLDLEYIDNWSLWRDFILLVRTIPVVLRGHGAH